MKPSCRVKTLKRKITAILFVIALLVIYVCVCASKSLRAIGKAQFEAEMSTATYIAIGKTIEDKSLEDLFSVMTDDNGNIVMISVNGLKMNTLTKTLAEECLKAYSLLAEGGVSVPIGAFTGLSFLTAVGKPVNMKLITVKSVKCEFLTQFEEAGINQTKQSLYLRIIPDCKVIAGFKSEALIGEVNLLCYENYLIGKVPDTYVNVSGYTAEKLGKG